ncbi:MAG: SIS domain-containing protein [Erysipelotrichaceae bacterium]|nr:SIS domain-containing protein [Erysipelotrichaceae bacterium]
MVKETIKSVLNELLNNSEMIDTSFEELLTEIINAKHIYISGAGRSGLMIKAFANRLMHLGKSVSIIGDVSNPATSDNNLLIIGSGSGETDSLVILAKKAKKLNLKIALITMDKDSSIAKLSDVVIVLPGVSPKLNTETFEITSIQPMGSAFEQMCLIAYDSIIIELMKKMNQTSDEMFKRHANLE